MKKIIRFFSRFFKSKSSSKHKPHVPIVLGQGTYKKYHPSTKCDFTVFEVKAYPASIGFLTKQLNLSSPSCDWGAEIQKTVTAATRKKFHAEAAAQFGPAGQLKQWDDVFSSYRTMKMRPAIVAKYKKYRRAQGAEILDERDRDATAVRDILAKIAREVFVGDAGWLGGSYYTGRVAFAPLPDGTEGFGREILYPEKIDGKLFIARSWSGPDISPYELPFTFDVLAENGNAKILG